MMKSIVFVLSAFLICSALGQDFEPDPLEPSRPVRPPQEATTENGGEVIKTTTTVTPTRRPPVTDSPYTTTTTTTTTTRRPFIPSTTPTTSTTLNPETTTAQDPFEKPGYPEAGRPANPWYPYPDKGAKKCYYYEQRTRPYFKWSCGTFHLHYNVECFECCNYGYTSLAGCSRVSNYFCSQTTSNYNHGTHSHRPFNYLNLYNF